MSLLNHYYYFGDVATIGGQTPDTIHIRGLNSRPSKKQYKDMTTETNALVNVCPY